MLRLRAFDKLSADVAKQTIKHPASTPLHKVNKGSQGSRRSVPNKYSATKLTALYHDLGEENHWFHSRLHRVDCDHACNLPFVAISLLMKLLAVSVQSEV